VRERLKALAQERPRFGYKRLHVLLRREGVVVNRKRVYRLYREERLLVRRHRSRKRTAEPRGPVAKPTQPNERWGMDFIHDSCVEGRRFRCLTMVDEFTRECPRIEVDTSLPASRVIAALDELALARGLPKSLVVDHGPEFMSQALDLWAYRHGVALEFIRPGKPVENAYIESFHSRFRDECLAAHWFLTLADARFQIEQFRRDYNDARPHSSLGNRSPREFTKTYMTNSQPPTTRGAIPQKWSRSGSCFDFRDQRGQAPGREEARCGRVAFQMSRSCRRCARRTPARRSWRSAAS
jgi:putative transposase